MVDFAADLSRLLQGATPTLDWNSLIESPPSAEDDARLRNDISKVLMSKFIEQLPPDGKKIVSQPNWSDEERRRITRDLDKFVIRVTESIGARVLFWDVVTDRILRWTETIGVDGDPDHGIELLQKFTGVLLHRAKLLRGQATGKVTNHFADIKAPMVSELKRFANMHKTSRNVARKKIDLGATVEANAFAFPNLHANLISLQTFCAAHPVEWDAFLSGATTATVIFRQWGGWTQNLDDETFRQRLKPTNRRKSL